MVMAGLVPAISVREAASLSDRDGRHKACHDAEGPKLGRNAVSLVDHFARGKGRLSGRGVEHFLGSLM
jgi:hypothetical protein